MDVPRHEYILEVFADQTFVKDIVKGLSIFSLALLWRLDHSHHGMRASVR